VDARECRHDPHDGIPHVERLRRMSAEFVLSIPGLTVGRDGLYMVSRDHSERAIQSSSAEYGRRQELEQAAAWAARIAEGDVKALEALMDAYALNLTRFATTMVSSSAMAEEIVQDVFVRLWDHRATLDPSGNLIGYLYRAVRNRALNAVQHERVRSAAEAQASVLRRTAEDNRALDSLGEDELRDEIAIALHAVAPRCREILTMVFEGHMSYADVASALGISTRSVQNQYYKAVAALAAHFNRRPSR